MAQSRQISGQNVWCIPSGPNTITFKLDAPNWLIQIAILWMIWNWSQLRLANREPLVQIPKEWPQQFDFELNEEEESKQRPLWKDSLHKMLQRHGGHIDSSFYGWYWYWDIPMITMMFLDKGTMNGHWILWLILPFSDGYERSFFEWLSMHQQTVLNLASTKHQIKPFCTEQKAISVPRP